MQISKFIKLGVSSYTIVGTGSTPHEALMDLQKMDIYDIEKCGACGSNLLRLRAYITKDDKYEYIKVVCNKCKASLTLGESKQDHVHYYRRNVKGKDWYNAEKPEGALAWVVYDAPDKPSHTATAGVSVTKPVEDINWDE